MSSKDSGKSNLIEIRDLLKLEMDKFTAINNEMIDNKSDFQKIGSNYNKYSQEVDKGRDHITQLKKREFFENMFVYIGFFFFYGCVAIVILRRFPLHKIIFWILSTFRRMLGFLQNQAENIPFFQNKNITSIVANITKNASSSINRTFANDIRKDDF